MPSVAETNASNATNKSPAEFLAHWQDSASEWKKKDSGMRACIRHFRFFFGGRVLLQLPVLRACRLQVRQVR